MQKCIFCINHSNYSTISTKSTISTIIIFSLLFKYSGYTFAYTVFK